MKAKAIILDQDGVLTDSSMQHYLSYLEVLKPHGLSFPPEEILLREGGKSATIIDAVARKLGKALPAEDVERLAREKQVAFRGLGKPRVFPSVPGFLQASKDRGYRLGLATGTTRQNIEFMLGSLLELIDAPVTMEDTRAEKPDPEPYLKASEKLHVPPAACTVIENAPNGVRAAKRAGMRCIALTTTLPEGVLGEADVIAADLDEALEWV